MPDSQLTVAEMADRLIKYCGDGSWNDLSDLQALHDASQLKLNCDKAHADLNWRSVLTIDESLQKTAEWYKKYHMENQNADVHALYVEQLRNCMDKATTEHLPLAK